MQNTKQTLTPSRLPYSKETILYNNQGIDTIRLIGKYDTVFKLCQRLGLEISKAKGNTPLSNKLKELNKLSDPNTRYKKEAYKPTLEVAKLAKGKALSNYMTITRNTPLLFEYATHHKKAKDTYCLIEFSGLHQPTSHIQKEAMQIISKFLKRKAFSLHSVDIATDTKDKAPINHKSKAKHGATSTELKALGVVSHASSLYINKPKSNSIGRVLYYDKYFKQTKHHKQKLAKSLKDWKRLEITLTVDIFKTTERKSFIEYINSYDFMEGIEAVHKAITKHKIKSYDNSYLLYQLNGFIDNRILNNKATVKQYNSKESIERFKASDFRRYILPLLY